VADVRKAASWLAIATGTVAALGTVAVKAVAASDRRRAPIHGRAGLDAAAHPQEPDGLRHHVVAGSDGARLHVVEGGPADAPTIVLLHGVTLSWEIWHLTIRALMNDHRVIAPDWRGHGSSTVGSGGYGLHLLAGDLRDVLVALDVRGAVVVGHSMGGMALMHFCRDHRDVLADRVAGLVFLSTAASSVIDGPGPAAVDALVGRIAGSDRAVSRAMRVPRGDLAWAVVRYGFGTRPPAEAIALHRRITFGTEPSAAGRSIAALVDHDATGWLGTVRLPTAVVVGSKDRLTPPAKARGIAALVPGADLTVMDGAGHLIMFERPAELEAILRRMSRA
jgi:pimeloyl-ACP methyl ester carboxylesterase